MSRRVPFYHPTPPNREEDVKLPLAIRLVPYGVSTAKTKAAEERDRQVYAKGFMVGVERAIQGDECPQRDDIPLPASCAATKGRRKRRAQEDAHALEMYRDGELDGWASQTNAEKVARRSKIV